MTQLSRSAVRIFAANDRMNQILIEHLDPTAWTAKPPGKTRTIAAIFTHMHNVRTKWIRLNAPHLEVPAQLDRTHCMPQQARAALAESAARCSEMLAEALGGGGRIEMFIATAGAGPGRLELRCCATCSRTKPTTGGRYAMLAHQLSLPLPIQVTSGLWNWEKLWKECGSPRGPRSRGHALAQCHLVFPRAGFLRKSGGQASWPSPDAPSRCFSGFRSLRSR